VPGASTDVLGPAPDGEYGLPGGDVAGVMEGDTIEEAVDKLAEILDKLAPARPPLLSSKTLSIVSTYSALEAGTSAALTHVIDSTAPNATTPSGVLNGFADGDTGTLSCNIDGVASGSRVLTTADDTGVYGALQILTDYDFYAGQAGKQNFWHALTAGIQPTSPLTLGSHTYQLIDTVTGSTPLYTFYVDNPGTPTITAASILGNGAAHYVSGVPCLSTGNTITASFTVGNAILKCYNPTTIASASSAYTTSANAPLPGSPPASGSNFIASISLTVNSGVYTENAAITCVGNNSKGGYTTQTVTGNIRIDSVSNETARSLSGLGQFPVKGASVGQFGGTFVSSATLVGTDELQMLDGYYQDPSHTNYSTNHPAPGPDYTSIAPGSYNSTRWVTMNIGSVSNASSLNVTVNGAVNFGSTALVSGISMYVLVDGATGWVDANAAYPGVGSPSANGDAALSVGSSTSTVKHVTFGAVTRTGNVWVRLGIPAGSNKKLTGFTLS
jgi:hypothetical protein